jgi:UDPglucose--hexose-1-phosphate uridylyltransferase
MPIQNHPLRFDSQTVTATLRDARGKEMTRPIEVRTHPITGRTCRITYSRGLESEPGTGVLPPAPPDSESSAACPFCPGNIERTTPRTHPGVDLDGRLRQGASTLFPNLFPYGAYSAVSLFGDRHFVEIGTENADAYADSFINCARYLRKVVQYDPNAPYVAITQNHLPAAGGSLVHPHLQVHADGMASNHHRCLMDCTTTYHAQTGRFLFSDYLKAEQADGRRIIGTTGPWHWLGAFAPEGFYEIWAIYPGKTSVCQLETADWQALSQGVMNTQRFYRSLCRNSYNLGLLAVEQAGSRFELRVVMIVRANYACWVRSDITSYEVMLGDMATFNAPEQTAASARSFW